MTKDIKLLQNAWAAFDFLRADFVEEFSHFFGSCVFPDTEAEYMNFWKADLFRNMDTLLEIFICFTRKTHDNIGRNSRTVKDLFNPSDHELEHGYLKIKRHNSCHIGGNVSQLWSWYGKLLGENVGNQ